VSRAQAFQPGRAPSQARGLLQAYTPTGARVARIVNAPIELSEREAHLVADRQFRVWESIVI
jgi:hypothetical protein